MASPASISIPAAAPDPSDTPGTCGLAPSEIEAQAQSLPYGVGFAFGVRFFILAASGMILWLMALARPHLAVGIAIWEAALAALWYFDLVNLPPPASLRARRKWSGTLHLGGGMRVSWRVIPQPGWTPSRHRAWARIRNVAMMDDLSTGLTGLPGEQGPRCELQLDPGAAHWTIAGEMSLHPQRRGIHNCGDLYLQYQSAWGLAVRRARVRLEQKATVYPDLEAARRCALPATPHQLNLRELRLSRRLERGREFEAMRPFQEGDEWRDIDWRATARTGRTMIKLRRQERSQIVWLVLDCGRLMQARPGAETDMPSAELAAAASPVRNYATAPFALLDLASTAALSLGMSALAGGDQVGLLAYGRSVQQLLPPAAGTIQLQRLLPALAMLRQEEGEANHHQAAAALLASQKRRALMVWLSDLPETAFLPELAEAGSLLARRHMLLLAIPRATSLEHLAAEIPRQPPQMYLAAAALETLERRRRALARLRQHGAHTLEVEAPGMAAALVARYLEIKQRGQL